MLKSFDECCGPDKLSFQMGMKMKTQLLIHSALLIAANLHAATIVGSPSFQSSFSGSSIDVTTMSNVVDWGYLDHGSINPFAAATTYNFTALTGANYDATSGIGAVTVTNNSVATASTQTTTSNTFIYSGGNSPASGTDTSIGGQFGSMASAENNAVTFDFNNLGLGQHTITLYLGHRLTSGNDTRVFNMDYSWFASDGNVTGNVQSNDLGATGASNSTILSAFQITVNNTIDADADLRLDWDSVSGGAGNAIIAGYTVQTIAIPEPSAALLGLLGLLVILRRRR